MTFNQAYEEFKTCAFKRHVSVCPLLEINLCKLIDETADTNSGSDVYRKLYKELTAPAERLHKPVNSLNKKRTEALASMKNMLRARYSNLQQTDCPRVDIDVAITSLFGISQSSPDEAGGDNLTNDNCINDISRAIISQIIRQRKVNEFVSILKEWLENRTWSEQIVYNFRATFSAGGLADSVLTDILLRSSLVVDGCPMIFTSSVLQPTAEQAKARALIDRILDLLGKELTDSIKKKYETLHWEIADKFCAVVHKQAQKSYTLAMKAKSDIESALCKAKSALVSPEVVNAAVNNASDSLDVFFETYTVPLYAILFGDELFVCDKDSDKAAEKEMNEFLDRDFIEDSQLLRLGMYLAFRDGEDYPWMLNISGGISIWLNKTANIRFDSLSGIYGEHTCDETGEYSYKDYYDYDEDEDKDKDEDGGDEDAERQNDTPPSDYLANLTYGREIIPILDCSYNFHLVEKEPCDEGNEGCSPSYKSVSGEEVIRSISAGINLDNLIRTRLIDVYSRRIKQIKAEEADVLAKQAIDDATVKELNETVKTLRAQLSEQNLQIIRLKEKNDCVQEIIANAKAEKDVAVSESKSAKAKIADMEKMIADLREVAFDLANEEGSLQNETVELPYKTEHNIIIFGGHESWLRKIKPMLPGVRFYGNQTSVNTDAIRGADGVYIQINKMCHSSWYRITEVCDSLNIPVKNFRFSSARLCAEDIVRFDKELGK